MVVAQEREEKKSVAGTRWYIVHAYTNFERKVADAIRERAKAGELENLFEEIVVPTEEVVEVKRGRKISDREEVSSGLRVGQDEDDRRGVRDDQEYAEGDGLPRCRQQADAYP